MVTSCVEAVQWLAFGALEPFLPLYCLCFGMKPVEIGILGTIQIVATALTSPMMGKLSDKHGRRPMISVGLALGAVGLAMIPFLRTFWTLIPAVVLFGVSFAAVITSTAASVSDLAKAESRGSALGVMSTIMDVGQSSGPILAGILLGASKAKVGVPGSNYKVMFFSVSLILLLMAGSFPLLVGKKTEIA